VCVYGGVCSLTSREWINRFAPNFACSFSETRKRFQKGQNYENSALGSNPSEVALGIRHDRRKAPRENLFVSAGRLQEQKKQPPPKCPGFESR
jgi:hypothetical protein